MKRLHIVGRKNHGKTSLVVDLVAELTSRGLVVGTIKHTSHRHELDVPGKDSHRHRNAGAAVSAILARGISAVFVPCRSDESVGADRYAALAPAFAGCDVLLVEGDSLATAPKLEVWRAEVGGVPLAEAVSGVLAIATDDAPPCRTRSLKRSDVAAIADWLLQTVG